MSLLKSLNRGNTETEELEEEETRGKTDEEIQRTPITMEITFTIRRHEGGELILHHEGRAYPHVSSGCQFGGCRDYKDHEQINKLVEQEKKWFTASYNRPIVEKITIVDERIKQGRLF
jgi:hypothetical protein